MNGNDPTARVMTGAEHNTYLADYEQLKTALVRAQAERRDREWWVDPNGDPTDGATGELAWMVYERGTMYAETNRLRDRYGLKPVSIEEVKRAESSAAGHFDYTTKYALGCADLVHQEAS